MVEELPTAVITMGLIAVAVIFGFLLAKLCDWCQQREGVADDASDISENTKRILRLQLEVMTEKRSSSNSATGKPEETQKKAESALRLWSNKLKTKVGVVPQTTDDIDGDDAAVGGDDDAGATSSSSAAEATAAANTVGAEGDVRRTDEGRELGKNVEVCVVNVQQH